jgi:hypothetical protein
MNALGNNIKIYYFYRDGGNYKTYGHEILSNLNNIDIAKIELTVKSKLFDGEFFVPSNWGLASLQQFNYDKDIDHDWHEIEKFELTFESPTMDIDISNFLINLFL